MFYSPLYWHFKALNPCKGLAVPRCQHQARTPVLAPGAVCCLPSDHSTAADLPGKAGADSWTPDLLERSMCSGCTGDAGLVLQPRAACLHPCICSGHLALDLDGQERCFSRLEEDTITDTSVTPANRVRALPEEGISSALPQSHRHLHVAKGHRDMHNHSELLPQEASAGLRKPAFI